MKNTKISIIGLGYVGLPLASEFAKKIKVIGFDVDKKRISQLKEGIDLKKEVTREDVLNPNLFYTCNPEDLKESNFFIIAVPTPVDNAKQPDLTLLLGACRLIGKHLKKGDVVITESTLYPGATEEDCMKALEEVSNLKGGIDFKMGHCPERINPGDREHGIDRIIKVVSGQDEETLDLVDSVYSLICTKGIHRATSIKVAEAAKIIENTQRDINIALMNELALIFDRLGINTKDVLDAANTKWNFLNFRPGLVGGHCIGVDPYYLTHKAAELSYHPEVVLSGRRINDFMGIFVARKAVKLIIESKGQLKNQSVIILGATFKENCPDIRNSKVSDLLEELKQYNLDIQLYDPVADAEDLTNKYPDLVCKRHELKKASAVILAVPHKQFEDLNINELLKENSVVIDIKGYYNRKDITEQGHKIWQL
ncbi:MAG: nucleotide sugar dehydrogenase [Bacteriovoracaceae bacterium]|nr:nucleotide sugar dehydrogenase [Bacteriovoracaceae bacterium]